jgi:LacI family transcriptional regulator
VLAWLNGLPNPKDLRKYREFDLCWRGAEQAAAKFGYRLEEVAFRNSASLQRAEKALRAREVCGILLPPQPGRMDGWASINLDGFAVMSLARNVEPPFTHCVSSGQAANAMLAFDRIREKGYSRIGYVGPLFRPRMFWAGFSWVQNEIPPDRHIPPLFLDNNELGHSLEGLSKWICEYRPDAIFTENPGLPQALAKIGVSVPRDIGLAAASVLDEPEIDAGIYQNFEEIGRVAVLSLISLINDRDYGIPEICRETLIKGDWVDGASLPDRTRTVSKKRRKR